MEFNRLAYYSIGSLLGASVVLTGMLANKAYGWSESADNYKAVLLAKGYDENKAACVKQLVKSLPLTEIFFAGGIEKKEAVNKANKACEVPEVMNLTIV